MSVGAVNKQTGERIPTAGMPAIDDALDLTSVNPVQNTVITAALALKQDKTDNSLQTTDKTVVGAVNELKRGFTTLSTTTLSGVSYIKCGRLVVATLSSVELSANVPLNTPAPTNNIVLVLRDETVGGCVQVVMSTQTIITPSAGNVSFVDGHRYSGTIVYISVS